MNTGSLPTENTRSNPPTLHWVGGGDGRLRLLDQTLLPVECREIECSTADEVWQAIRRLSVRGAPSVTTRPAVGRSRPPTMPSRVDLPQPDGPMIATVSPSRTIRSTASSTSRSS